MYTKKEQNYFIIRAIHDKNVILIFYYNASSSNYPACFTTSSSTLAFRLMCLCDCFNNLSISHLLYLSRELYKAELAIYMKQNYVQD